ncbi:MAG: alcohol dehydrogenase catalytic domain-containing protein [Chloroflexi bacterium]|nr:alcohol dehydrogenase catalytic domain-containing protein [Chloroflexota bacterium]MCY3696278.1 alcohol dehydrogenase catalytic domain-containing protein [Chloroflexota bacterium]MXX32892.1 alcohol dehydrogenase catalytic domain-containing protein [Chloroflexota bacterium]MYD16833.1 alcohol dehydrogenase catalytic domain-containing protein [Chloroflexota bacterium]
MRALIFDRPGDIRVDDIPTPQPGPGEAVIEVGAASVCASDLRVYRGEKYAKPGVVPGHEFAGRVVAVGDGVTDLRLGDGVAVYPIIACGGCDFCRRGLRNRCTSRRTLGYDANGGLAEQVLLPAPLVSQGHAVKLAEGADWGRAALTEPTACVLNSLESCRFRAGVSVAVLGAGPMGLLHVLLARALGAGEIIVAEPVDVRRDAAVAIGASRVCSGDSEELRAVVDEATAGHGCDIVVVSVGLNGLTETALQVAGRQSSVNLFAGFPPESSALVDVNDLHYREVSLTGTQNATPDQFRRTAALLPTLDAVDRIVSHRFALSEADQAYTSRDDAAVLKTAVLPDG